MQEASRLKLFALWDLKTCLNPEITQSRPVSAAYRRLEIPLLFCALLLIALMLCSRLSAATPACTRHPVTGRPFRAARAATADGCRPARPQAAQLCPDGHGSHARAAQQSAPPPDRSVSAADGSAFSSKAGAGLGPEPRALCTSAATAAAAKRSNTPRHTRHWCVRLQRARQQPGTEELSRAGFKSRLQVTVEFQCYMGHPGRAQWQPMCCAALCSTSILGDCPFHGLLVA